MSRKSEKKNDATTEFLKRKGILHKMKGYYFNDNFNAVMKYFMNNDSPHMSQTEFLDKMCREGLCHKLTIGYFAASINPKTNKVNLTSSRWDLADEYNPAKGRTCAIISNLKSKQSVSFFPDSGLKIKRSYCGRHLMIHQNQYEQFETFKNRCAKYYKGIEQS